LIPPAAGAPPEGEAPPFALTPPVELLPPSEAAPPAVVPGAPPELTAPPDVLPDDVVPPLMPTEVDAGLPPDAGAPVPASPVGSEPAQPSTADAPRSRHIEAEGTERTFSSRRSGELKPCIENCFWSYSLIQAS